MSSVSSNNITILEKDETAGERIKKDESREGERRELVVREKRGKLDEKASWIGSFFLKRNSVVSQMYNCVMCL